MHLLLFSFYKCHINSLLLFSKVHPYPRLCLKNAFCKMCVTICGRFRLNEGGVAGYFNWMKTKYTANWGVQVAEMIFQTRSNNIFSNQNPWKRVSAGYITNNITWHNNKIIGKSNLVEASSPSFFALSIRLWNASLSSASINIAASLPPFVKLWIKISESFW